MFPRLCLNTVFILTLGFFVPMLSASAAGNHSTDAAETAEARRLYERANDSITNIEEGDYSYAYMQFYWKRAQSNIDRILRVYPKTPIAAGLENGELKLGPFELGYFKERVLPALEEKKLNAFDAVNCAIFLYHRDEARWDETRRAALQKILEVLARQKRWSEARKFPVLDADRFLRWSAIFRVAARYEETEIVKEMLAHTEQAELPQMHAILGEALALRGRPRKEIAELLDKDPADEVKLGGLSGMIRREIKIQRAAALRIPATNIVLLGGRLKNPEVRDDIQAVAKTFFPRGNVAAGQLLAGFRAALGERPAVSAASETQLAHLEYLAVFDKFDELIAYLRDPGINNDTRSLCELKAIELLAEAGRSEESERLCEPYRIAGGALAEAAALAQFRGQMNSTEVPLTVREKTFASLPMKDPCVVAQAIMEWSLTPNRSIRGAAPYDAVVQKFAGGFENLPLPKSKAVGEAASVQMPY